MEETPSTCNPSAQKSRPAFGAEGLFGQVGVGKPSSVGDRPHQEAGVHQQSASQEQPVAQGIESGEGYIAGADGEGNDEVEESGAQGH